MIFKISETGFSSNLPVIFFLFTIFRFEKNIWKITGSMMEVYWKFAENGQTCEKGVRCKRGTFVAGHDSFGNKKFTLILIRPKIEECHFSTSQDPFGIYAFFKVLRSPKKNCPNSWRWTAIIWLFNMLASGFSVSWYWKAEWWSDNQASNYSLSKFHRGVRTAE